MVKDLFLSTFRVSYPPNAVDNCAQLWTTIPRALTVTPKNLRFRPQAQSGVKAPNSTKPGAGARRDVLNSRPRPNNLDNNRPQ